MLTHTLTNINLSSRNLIGICAVLAVLNCFILAKAGWQWRHDWLLIQQTSAAPVNLPRISEITSMIAAIPDEHIFGSSAATGEVPVSSLQFHVTGIVKQESEEYGSYSKAYISVANQPSKIYQVGDSLPYGVKVYAITPNAVILENNGHLEKLPLPRDQLMFNQKESEDSI